MRGAMVVGLAIALSFSGGAASADLRGDSACEMSADLRVPFSKGEKTTLRRTIRSLRDSEMRGAHKLAARLSSARSDVKRGSALADLFRWCEANAETDQANGGEVDEILDLTVRGSNALTDNLGTSLPGVLAGFQLAAADWDQAADRLLNDPPGGVPDDVAQEVGSALRSAADGVVATQACLERASTVADCQNVIDTTAARTGSTLGDILKSLIPYGTRSLAEVQALLVP